MARIANKSTLVNYKDEEEETAQNIDKAKRKERGKTFLTPLLQGLKKVNVRLEAFRPN